MCEYDAIQYNNAITDMAPSFDKKKFDLIKRQILGYNIEKDSLCFTGIVLI